MNKQDQLPMFVFLPESAERDVLINIVEIVHADEFAGETRIYLRDNKDPITTTMRPAEVIRAILAAQAESIEAVAEVAIKIAIKMQGGLR